MAKVIVYHTGYGCDTGCCGHAVQTDEGFYKFSFDHPYRSDNLREYAEGLIAEVMGPEHVKDLDWENSWVVDD